jgi:Putative Flp pilus-assembly TadE/G-like
MVLFAVFITLFVMLCAVVIDVGYWWANAKKAQIAADACALAAAQELPQDWGGIPPGGGAPVGTARTECHIDTLEYVTDNLPDQSEPGKGLLHLSTRVVSPYDEKIYQVEATVKVRVRTFFGTIFGRKFFDIERRAVAEQATGVNEVAIHAHDSNCDNDAIVMNGKNIDIEGIVESNGFFETNGEDITTGPATGGGPLSCEIKVNGEDISFGGADEPTDDPIAHPWPFYVVPGEHPFDWPNSCDFVGENIEFDVPNGVIPPGVYCAEESFEVKAEGMRGNITVFAPLIKVGGKNTEFAPSQRALDAGKPLLFMHLPNSTATTADDGPEPFCETGYRNKMELNAEGIKWTGVLFNPCDHININGALNAALEGMIVAQTVRINGENFNIEKISTAGNNKRLALVE